MNVLHVIDSQGLFGAENLLINLMEQQNLHELTSKLLSIGNQNNVPKDIEIECQQRGLSVIPIRFSDGFNLNGSRKILQIASAEKTDIIHSHGYKSDILLGIIPKSYRKIPIISTLHGWTAVSIFQKLWFYQLLRVLFLKKIEKVVCVSPLLRQDKKLKFFGIIPEFVPNGIPELNFGDEIDKRLSQDFKKFKDDHFTLVVTGRLSREKGYDILIQAISLLKEQGRQVKLVIMGDGPQKKDLIELVNKKKVENNILFAGYLKHAYRYFSLFDLFVISSHTEGLPISLLEAMQMGIPILSTSVGAIPMVLKQGEYGELVSPAHPQLLTQKIIFIQDNYEMCKQKAQKAIQYCKSEYSIEKTYHQYFEFYRELTNRRIHPD